jgi:hypothetical protein
MEFMVIKNILILRDPKRAKREEGKPWTQVIFPWT